MHTIQPSVAENATTTAARRLLIVTATFAFLLAGSLGLLIHVRTVRQMEVESYSALANVVSVNCLRPVTYRRHLLAAEALSLLAQVRAVCSASIILQDGSILATYERAQSGQDGALTKVRHETHQYVNPPPLLITAPIGTAQIHQGTLLLRADALTPWSFLAEHASWWAAAYATAFVSAIAAVVSLRRCRNLTRFQPETVPPSSADPSSDGAATFAAISPARLIESRNLSEVHPSEAAAEVLHNVGNVLNSVNVSVQTIRERVSRSRADRLRPAISLIQEHRQNLGNFLTDDARGRLLPDFLEQLSQAIEAEQSEICQELAAVETCVNHINNLINLQQASATSARRCEYVSAIDLMEDALTLNQASLGHHGIHLERDYQFSGMLHVDRHKLLQILINLISNARNALQSADVDHPRLTLSITTDQEEHCCFTVADNGAGISPEHLSRLFQDGFTTRHSGHGFGLHSAALAARDLGGELHSSSGGSGLGVEFTLMIPVTIGEVCPCPA